MVAYLAAQTTCANAVQLSPSHCAPALHAYYLPPDGLYFMDFGLSACRQPDPAACLLSQEEQRWPFSHFLRYLLLMT